MGPDDLGDIFLHGHEFYRILYIYIAIGSSKGDENRPACSNWHGIPWFRWLDHFKIYFDMKGYVYLADVVTLDLDVMKCTGCRMCLVVCPHAVFGIKDKKAVILHKDLCMECGACAKNCEPGAITVKSGVGCAAGIINGLIRGTEPTCDCGPDGTCC